MGNRAKRLKNGSRSEVRDRFIGSAGPIWMPASDGSLKASPYELTLENIGPRLYRALSKTVAHHLGAQGSQQDAMHVHAPGDRVHSARRWG